MDALEAFGMLQRATSLLAFTMAILIPAETAMAADRYANVHTVAIVSVLGDSIRLEQKTDLTRNDMAPPVPFDTRAGLDAVITKAIEGAISSRFTILNVPADPAFLSTLSFSPSGTVSMPERPDPQSGSPDAYIVVHPITSTIQTPIRALRYTYSSAALTRTKIMFGGYGHALSLQYRVSVLDARTGKQLDYGTAQLRKPSLLSKPLPFLGCDARLWPADPAHVDDATAAQLRVELLAIIARSLPIALESAHLVESAGNVQPSIPLGGTSICRTVD